MKENSERALRVLRPLLRVAVTAALLGTFIACGGGSDGGAPGPAPAPAPTPPPPPPPPPPGNQPPLAAFTSATNVMAGDTVVLDAAASTDPDGDPLVYTWSFVDGDGSDGGRGGGVRIAHAFLAPGNATVKLTVSDGRGGVHTTTRAIAIGAPPPPLRTVPVRALVKDAAGLPLAGVAMSLVNAGGSTSSDAQGNATLVVGTGIALQLKFAKAGYADQIVPLNLPDATGSDGYVEVQMLAREAPLALADAVAGGVVVGKHGAKVDLPPAALVDRNGNAITGAVQMTLTPIDVTGAAWTTFPGAFEGITPTGTRDPIASYGTTEFTLTQAGQKLQLAEGRQASIEMPLYATLHLDGTAVKAGDTIPLWSLDERSGVWVQEGTTTVVASAASPTGLAARATVSHFSWWNIDARITPFNAAAGCVNDVPGQYDNLFAQAQVCSVFGDIDRSGNGPIVARAARGAAGNAAAVPRVPLPATRASTTIAMGTRAPLKVPADVNVILTGFALNGTWSGSVVVNGAANTTRDVSIPLRPVSLGGQGETILLPFDQVRIAQQGVTDRYLFSAPAGQIVEVSLERAASTLDAGLRVIDPSGNAVGTSELTAAQTATLQFSSGVGGVFAIEIVPRANAPAGYRLLARLRAVGGIVGQYQAIGGVTIDGVPLIAADPAGNAIAVWQAGDGGQPDYGNYGSYYDAATGTWSAPQQLSQPLSTSAFETIFTSERKLVFGAGGHGALAWLESGTTGHRIRAALFDPVAKTWSPAQLLFQNTAGNVSLAVDPTGNVFVAWKGFDGSAAGSVRVRRASGGVWEAERTLTPLNSGVVGTDVKTDANGNAYVVWSHLGAAGVSTTGVFARRYDAATATWGSLETIGTELADSTQLGVDGGGNVVAAWVRSQSITQASRRAAAGGWSAPVSFDDFLLPRLAVAGTGDALLTGLGSGNVNRARYFTATAGTWGGPEAATPFSISNTAQPYFDGRGNPVVVFLTNAGPAPAPSPAGWFGSRRIGGSWTQADRLEETSRQGGGLGVAVVPNGVAFAVRNATGRTEVARFVLIP